MGQNFQFKPKRNLCFRYCLKADKIVICQIAHLFFMLMKFDRGLL